MKMSISYRNQIIILVLWVFAVMALFEFVPNRKMVGFAGGIGFVLIALLILVSELSQTKIRSVAHFVSTALFLVLAALPIFLLRVLNWNAEFSSLSIFGLQAYYLHKISFVLYMLMILTCSYSWFKNK